MLDGARQDGGARGRDDRQLVEAGEEARGEQEAAEEMTLRDLDAGPGMPGCPACDEMMN